MKISVRLTIMVLVATLGLAAFAAVALVSIPGVDAEVAFGLVSLATGLVLAVPAGLCVRLTLRQRASAAAS